jgi:hypothetical protein
MDLTQITTPFGLLDEATQKALRDCGRPWECYGVDDWLLKFNPDFTGHLTYRLKPQPPKPREWWIHYDNSIVLNYVPDDDGSFKAGGYIHVREVIE